MGFSKTKCHRLKHIKEHFIVSVTPVVRFINVSVKQESVRFLFLTVSFVHLTTCHLFLHSAVTCFFVPLLLPLRALPGLMARFTVAHKQEESTAPAGGATGARPRHRGCFSCLRLNQFTFQTAAGQQPPQGLLPPIPHPGPQPPPPPLYIPEVIPLCLSHFTYFTFTHAQNTPFRQSRQRSVFTRCVEMIHTFM